MSPHVLALDIAGAPHRWINVRDAALYYATDMVAWSIGVNEDRAPSRGVRVVISGSVGLVLS